MILIISEKDDNSAKKIINLCKTNSIPYFEIFNEDKIIIDDIEIINGVLKNFSFYNERNRKKIWKNSIKSFFYRQGLITPNINLKFKKNVNDIIRNELTTALIDEFNSIIFYIFDYIESNVKCIGNYNNNIPNKLVMLRIASMCGLKTPNTYIYTDFTKRNINYKEYITKSIQDIIGIVYENNIYFSYTALPKKSIIENNYFSNYPSLIQKRIKKQFEIRSFFFADKIFSVAILNSEKTDYRENNITDIIPYTFNKIYLEKILKFIDNCGFNSGSMDFIVDENDEIFFLEINPHGQFDFISDYCGNNIEIEIFNYLTRN